MRKNVAGGRIASSPNWCAIPRKPLAVAATLAVAFCAWAGLYIEDANGIKWNYTVSGGNVRIENYFYTEYNPSVRYVSAIPTSTTGAITVPSTLGGYPVTSIGNSAFYGCSGLTSVVIPDSVTSIGDFAFFGCSSLTSVTIPDSVTSIESGAFKCCEGLMSVLIGNSVTNIGVCAFESCVDLTSVTIPDSVISIGNYAFYGCNKLKSISIGNGVTRFGDEWVDGCPAYELQLYRTIFGRDAGSESPSVVTTIVEQVAAPYALTDAVADRAIASVTVDGDCAIDEFVLKDGEVYDTMVYVNNTAASEVLLTLPAGYTYKTIKGVAPLKIPAASQCLISITRVAPSVFLVLREELDDVQ